MSGLLFGFLCLVLQNHQLVQDSLKKNQTITTLAIGSFLTFLIYGVFVNSCQSKFQCAENHAYIEFLPVTKASVSLPFLRYIEYYWSEKFCFSKSRWIICLFFKGFVSKKTESKCKQIFVVTQMVSLILES